MADPASAAHAGIGAFNLVRAEAYWAIGGHATVRLRPDDNMRLGKALKQAGFRQGFALGQPLLRVEWYQSVPALVRGLDKGVFAGLDYSVIKTGYATVVPVFCFLWPIVGLCWGGWTAWICTGICLLFAVLYRDQVALHALPTWTVVCFPVCGALFLWILWHSAYTTLRRGGIEWRGTFYSLGNLRRG